MDATVAYRLIRACEGGDHMTIAATVNGNEKVRFTVTAEEARNNDIDDAEFAKALFLVKLKGLTRNQARQLINAGFTVQI